MERPARLRSAPRVIWGRDHRRLLAWPGRQPLAPLVPARPGVAGSGVAGIGPAGVRPAPGLWDRRGARRVLARQLSALARLGWRRGLAAGGAGERAARLRS